MLHRMYDLAGFNALVAKLQLPAVAVKLRTNNSYTVRPTLSKLYKGSS